MSELNEELKPCLWASDGSKGHRLARVNERDGQSYVFCQCGVQGPFATTEAKAVELWNQRLSTAFRVDKINTIVDRIFADIDRSAEIGFMTDNYRKTIARRILGEELDRS